MPSRCLNQVSLIGNLTRDPELKYTPSGMAVVSFGLATNRAWTTRDGERKEDAQFHRIVAWNKLAELCSQLLAKGRRVYVQGRIQYREFSDQEGMRKQIPEIVISDMILLDNKRVGDRQMARSGPDQGMKSAEKPVSATVDDGTIEDIVIPDEIGEVAKSTETSKVAEKDDGIIEPVADKKEEKEDKTETKEEEEMPF